MLNFALLMLLTVGQPPVGPFYPVATGQHFQDVPATHWAADAVERLYREGIVIGYPATKR